MKTLKLLSKYKIFLLLLLILSCTDNWSGSSSEVKIKTDKTSLSFSSEFAESASFNLINNYPNGAVVQKIEIPSNFSLTGLSKGDTLSGNSKKNVTCTYNGNGFPSTNSFIKIHFNGDIVVTITLNPITFSWQAGGWGVCDSTNLTQSRTVTCKSSTGTTVSDSYCTETKPTTSQSCLDLKFVLVEKGSFQMGDDTDSYNDNTVHTVNITKDFYVGKYEVTNKEVVEVYNWAKANSVSGLEFTSSSVKYNSIELLDLDDNTCQIGYNSDGTLYVKDSKESYPCIEITKYGADAFCEFLNKKEGVTERYRLLTEAEWEYTARGGNKSKGYTYSGSNTLDEVAWYTSNSSSTSHEVGGKSPNELGIYDMSGNVYEWVRDYYSSSYYLSSPTDNPVNTTSSSYFVLRGGSWYNDSNNCRVTSRNYGYPADLSDRNIGFRLAKSLSIQSDKTSLDFSSENTKSVSFNLINDYPTGAVVQKIELPSNFSLTGLSVDDTLSANSTKSVTCTYNGNGFPSTNSFIKIYFEDDIVISIIIEKPIEFVLVEKGSFQMGSDSGEYYEKPAHTVNITNDFYVGKYEVTNAQVVQVYNWAKANSISGLEFTSTSVKYNSIELLDLDSSSCQIGYNSDGTLYVKDNKENYPCIAITKYGADAFCTFLNKKEGITDIYRLLTEAEWEYTSRGGSKSKGYTYSGSNTIDYVAWHYSNSSNNTHEVGGKSPNELGLYDMSGNVYEWVQDYYSSSYYSSSPSYSPVNTTTSSAFVVRGGSWGNYLSYCRVFSRKDYYPYSSDSYVGFRLAKSINNAYTWQTEDWGTCTNGSQTRDVSCKSSYGVTVLDSSCTETKPITTQSCIIYTWQTEDWGVCNSETLKQSRTVYCKSSDGATVSDSSCTETKPITTQSCISYTWQTGDWGVCNSETLKQSRTVYCKSSDGATVSDSSCTETKPITTQSCIIYTWQTEDWGVCNSETLKQSRTVYCKSSDGATVSDSSCTGTKPITTQSCISYSWQTEDWGVCNSETIKQSRTVYCKSSNGATVADSNCTETKPATTQSCATVLLNDTGIRKFGNSSSNIFAAEPSDYPGQDGSYGRDITNNDDSDGNAGFSFTKISSTGSKLPSSATEWSCVQDNVTGLMWEVKTDDSGLQDKDNTYTWYNPDSTKNGGDAGTQNRGSCSGEINCDTYSYVNKINTDGLCGYKDWRMPKKEELRSIVDYSRLNSSIDTAYFPNTISSYYWSSSTCLQTSRSYALELSFMEGSDWCDYKGDPRYVRLVRMGQ